MQKLPFVVKMIGPDRTQTELIPWLEVHICCETPKFEDELLLALTDIL